MISAFEIMKVQSHIAGISAVDRKWRTPYDADGIIGEDVQANL